MNIKDDTPSHVWHPYFGESKPEHFVTEFQLRGPMTPPMVPCM